MRKYMKTTSRNRFILIASTSYLVFALFWIFLSDQFLTISADIKSMVWLSTAKGVFFVISTTVMLIVALHTVPPQNASSTETLLDKLATGLTPSLAKYLFAFIISLSMLLVRGGIALSFEARPLMILFIFPIILSAYIGGLWPGLLSTATVALGLFFFMMPPLHSSSNTNIFDRIQLGILVANGFAVSLLSEMFKRSYAKAETNRRLLNTVVTGTTDAIFIKDREGRYVLLNKAAEGFIGKKVDEIIGYDDNALFSEPTARTLMAEDRSIMETGKIMTSEIQAANSAGRVIDFSQIKGAIIDKQGRCIGMFGISRDISERKLAEENLRAAKTMFEAALANMSDAVFISDTTGKFTHFNDAFVTFHKFRNKEECAKTFDEYPKFIDVYLITGELVPVENWAVPSALRGEIGTGVEFRLLRKDTGQTWFGSYNYAPIHNQEGCIVGSVVTARDISESKAAEEKITGYIIQLEKAMRSTLQAVANVVEAHDPYTAGHEWRVGIIAADLAREMGWSEEKCDTLHLIGLVHDIGKMSVPAEILSKPGRLSAIEFELVKTHAEQGYQILKDVEFPLPIARIIREHHERMDGSGYPQGLKGDEILIEARILAVADVLEAMASHRPYRPSLGLEEAISEIESHRVQHFDPEVVDALLHLFREKGYQLPA